MSLLPAVPAAATSLTLGAASGAPLTTITFTGATDNATAGWTLYWGSTGGTVLATGTASSGSASGSFTVPEAVAGANTVVLQDNVTGTTASAAFTVTPSITVTPTSAAPGTSITVTGHGFTALESAITVTFDTAIMTSAVSAGANGMWTASITVPEAAGGASHVLDAYGANTTAASVTDLAFTIIPVFTLTPVTGPVGTSITAAGKGFAVSETGINITLDGVSVATAAAGANGSFTATFNLPDTTRGAHVVDAYGATTAAASVADLSFTATSGLSVNPVTGPAGTPITVTGTGFMASESGIVVILGTRTVKDGITADARGRWTATFNLPAGAGGSQAVNAYGPATVTGTVTPITFSVTSQMTLSAPGGKVGAPVSVNGSSFAGGETGISVTWDGNPVASNLTADASGNFAATFNVPPAASGAHQLRAAGSVSQTGAQSTFTVAPDLAASPAAGNVGTPVALTGTGFGASRALTVTYDGQAVTLSSGAATSNAQGGFTLSIAAPRSKGGSHSFKVTDGASSLEAAWAMETTPPPVPSPAKPTKGEIKSLFGDADAVFEWTPVTDPSGLTYSLQVAQDEAFTGLVLDKTDLTATSLTISKMPLGTYYWRVKAVDFASNASAWSAVYDFKSGFMPIWAFALSIVGILLVLIILIRFLVRRNSY
jgi:hypothetical protein